MWSLYGNTYDLTSYLRYHPGGKEILEKTRGIGDCTALFESYHAFSDITEIRKSLEKYKVEDTSISTSISTSKKSELYDFTTYHELIERIKVVYPDRQSIKPSFHWWTLVAGMGIGYAFLLYHILWKEHGLWINLCLCCLLGLFDSFIQFSILHDSSHYALFLDSNKNNRASTLSNSWMLWNHTVWFFHHVFYHHSFTGSSIDPDTNLFNNYKMSASTINFLFMVFPGQYVTQIFWYLISVFSHDFYTLLSFIRQDRDMKKPEILLPPRDFFYFYDIPSLLVMIVKCCILSRLPIISLILYFIVLNTLYYINVMGNHDLYSTIENLYDGPDWAKRQICNSGNFMNSSVIWSFLFGGINYQIEHHLFPNVNNSHYRRIAPIVKQFCLEKNIPYVHTNTLMETHSNFIKRTWFDIKH